MKSSIIRPVWTEAGLGNPPTEFSTNNVKAANFMDKYGLHVDPQEPHVFIESVKDFIKTQYRNKDRAVFGKGPYRLRKGFEHFLVSDLKWSSMAAVQRLNKVKEFQKADMWSRKDYSCREKMQNPPKLAPDDIVMAYKDIHQFRNPVTGVLRYSDAPQHAHFHLRSVCVRTSYPNFSYTWLNVPLQM